MEIQISSSVVAFGSAAMAFRQLPPIPSSASSLSTTASAGTTSAAHTQPPHTHTHTHTQTSSSIKVIKLRRDSNSFSARKSATLEVQQASDLPSALARIGEILTVKDLNAILHHFGNSNMLQHVSQLFLWMQENKKLDASSYSHYMRFMANKLDAGRMLQLYSSIQDESMKSNVYVCNSVLGCLVRKGKFDTSLKLFQQMKGDGLVPDVVTYSTVALK